MADENIVIPELNEKKTKEVKKKDNKIKGKRKALMIVTIVLFFISFAFSAFTIYYLLDIFFTKDNAASAIGFILYLLTFGWITYLPALGTSIAGVCTGAIASRSSSKKIKTTSIIFLILNIIILIAIVIAGIIILLFPSAIIKSE